MSTQAPSFSLGIEEEYLLIDTQTRDLASNPPPDLMRAAQAKLGASVAAEFLRCQIEIGTPVCHDARQAREHLLHLRGTIAEIASAYGLAPLAVSTHPFAHWRDQMPTDKDRYRDLAQDLQMVVRRLMVSGMHVHVGIEDENTRFDLFRQLPYFLPHLLALSTSSPFWESKRSGLMSYRLSVFDELPRRGLPEHFADAHEYHRTVAMLVDAGLIEDASKIWWDLRPSTKFPTLEMRITDVATRVDDVIAIAVLYRCIARMLYRLRLSNQRWRIYSRFIIAENRWLAQRYGVKGQLVDFGKGACVDFAALINELTGLIAQDAEFFGCEAEIEHVRNIVSTGTSADRQIARFDELKADGQSDTEALRGVVDWLRAETVRGC